MAIAVVVLVVSTGLGSVAGPSAVAVSGADKASSDRYVSTVAVATDDARRRNNLRSLRRGACLERAAHAQAARMARRGEVFHNPGFGAVGRRCGLGAWAENVAQAAGTDRGRGVVRQWMRSSGHRANIVNRGYRLVGTGAVRARGSWWVVQVFGRKS